jgi:hypothetical protein
MNGSGFGLGFSLWVKPRQGYRGLRQMGEHADYEINKIIDRGFNLDRKFEEATRPTKAPNRGEI